MNTAEYVLQHWGQAPTGPTKCDPNVSGVISQTQAGRGWCWLGCRRAAPISQCKSVDCDRLPAGPDINLPLICLCCKTYPQGSNYTVAFGEPYFPYFPVCHMHIHGCERSIAGLLRKTFYCYYIQLIIFHFIQRKYSYAGITKRVFFISLGQQE